MAFQLLECHRITIRSTCFGPDQDVRYRSTNVELMVVNEVLFFLHFFSSLFSRLSFLFSLFSFLFSFSLVFMTRTELGVFAEGEEEGCT